MSDALARLTAALADKYRIEREIGAGGMATVYLAQDIRHGRQVALKVLRPELAATLGSERFFREIQVAARLQHPHILPLHDSGEAGGFLYFVMPYVDGESLRDRLARVGELPVHDAVKILVEVVDALAYAHSQGVVHRDIKPDNVMISGRHALVTDFGVAKAVSEATGRQQLTTAGVALGTPSYMAPEQAAADPNLDHRVDIYAVGAMAYELLTGRPPFTGMTSQQILAAHVTQIPDPVSRHRPTCPPALEAVIMRCLAKRAADRWQTAEELLNNLEPLATPSGGMTPTQTRPVTAWQEATGTKKWMPAAVARGGGRGRGGARGPRVAGAPSARRRVRHPTRASAGHLHGHRGNPRPLSGRPANRLQHPAMRRGGALHHGHRGAGRRGSGDRHGSPRRTGGLENRLVGRWPIPGLLRDHRRRDLGRLQRAVAGRYATPSRLLFRWTEPHQRYRPDQPRPRRR